MKTIPLTRRLKEQLCAILAAGGSISSVDGELARTPYEARQRTADEWARRQAARARRQIPDMPRP